MEPKTTLIKLKFKYIKIKVITDTNRWSKVLKTFKLLTKELDHTYLS